MICMEADKGLSRLHRHEMEMMLALNSLEQATGRKMAGEVIFPIPAGTACVMAGWLLKRCSACWLR